MTARTMPHLVQTGPRTEGVLRLHSTQPAETAGPAVSGTSALAPAQTRRPAARLHAVPPPDEAEEVRRLASAITRATMEVLAGTRPVQQLAPWLHRDLLAAVQLRADLSRAARTGRPTRAALVHRAATVRSAHAHPIGAGLYEAAVVVADAARCRAVALRIESGTRAGWEVTALEIG